MKNRWTYVAVVLIVLSFLLGSAAPVDAQGEPPPAPSGLDQPEYQLEDQELLNFGATYRNGMYLMQGAPIEQQEEVEAAASYSSPDGFGYRYQKVTPAWINAKDGIKLEFIEAPDYEIIELPFAMRFYGHVYRSIAVLRYGYMILGSTTTYHRAQSPLKDETDPSSIIAPYWAPLVTPDYGGVYMMEGGEEPNRWVAFQWDQMADAMNGEGSFTFEVVLYENGQILFQYNEMQYPQDDWWCGSSGIEERNGMIGLVTLKLCYVQPSYRAVRFFPPKPSARVGVEYAYYGGLAMPGDVAQHRFWVENTGDKGTDVYDISLSSKWPAQLFRNIGYEFDELEALTDTDGDKKVDTGPLNEGQRVEIVINISVPPTTKVGYRLQSTVKITSSLNKSKGKTVRLHSAVPTNFVQLHRGWLNSIMLFRPDGLLEVNLFLSWEITGSYIGIVENTQHHFYQFSETWDCAMYDESGETCIARAEQPELSILKNDGEPVLFLPDEDYVPTRLLDAQTGITQLLLIEGLVAAPSSDGMVGFIWRESIYDDMEVSTDNLSFVMVDGLSHDPIAEPTNLTNNDQSSQYYYEPKIAGTDDGKFIVTWRSYNSATGVNALVFAVLNPDGSFAVAPVMLADSSLLSYTEQYSSPSATQLAGGKALLAWSKYVYKNRKTSRSIEYAVVDSTGTVLKRSSFSTGSTMAYGLDGAQMSGGEIVLAWQATSSNKSKIYYTILNGSSYKKTKGPVALNASSSLRPGFAVSVTVDSANRAVITWQSTSQKQIYYTLLGKNGSILTQPMVFKSHFFMRGCNGYENTTYMIP